MSLLLAILALGFAVRLYDFGAIPPGFNQDEASAGYDAYALLHYGVDRNGYHNPVHLVAWGSGQNALYSYLAMPFIAHFGLNTPAVRAVNLVAALLSLPVFYALVRALSGRRVALVALALLAIAPWHVMLSRWALESNLLPAVLLAAVWLLARATDRLCYLPVAMAALAVALYAYGTAYVIVAVFVPAAALWFRYHGIVTTPRLLGALSVFAVLALPAGLFIAVNVFELGAIRTPVLSVPNLPGLARYSTTLATVDTGFLMSAARSLRDFAVLLVTQYDGRPFNAIPGYGCIYLFTTPFACVGVLEVWRRVRARHWRDGGFFMLLWLLACVVLVLFLREPTINRTNAVYLPLVYFAAEGMVAIGRWTGARSGMRQRLYAATLVVLYAGSFYGFTAAYFGPHRERLGAAFFESFGEAGAYAAARAHGPICFTGRVNMPYIFLLFETAANPHTFLASVRYANPGAEFQWVASYDRYSFGARYCAHAPGTAYVLRHDEPIPPSAQELPRHSFKHYVVLIPDG